MKTLIYYENLVTKLPQYLRWFNPEGFHDSINEMPEFADNITDEDKIMATIAAYNKIELVATYKTIQKVTGFDRDIIKTIIHKNKPLVYLHATHDEETGLLNGKGWVFNELY